MKQTSWRSHIVAASGAAAAADEDDDEDKDDKVINFLFPGTICAWYKMNHLT